MSGPFRTHVTSPVKSVSRGPVGLISAESAVPTRGFCGVSGAAWKPQWGVAWPGPGDGPAHPEADTAPAGEGWDVLPTAQLEGLLGEHQRPSSGNARIAELRGRSRGPPPTRHPTQSLPRAGAVSPALAWARLPPGPQVLMSKGQERSPARREETGRPLPRMALHTCRTRVGGGASWSSRPKGNHEGAGAAAPASEGRAPVLRPPSRGVERA